MYERTNYYYPIDRSRVFIGDPTTKKEGRRRNEETKGTKDEDRANAAKPRHTSTRATRRKEKRNEHKYTQAHDTQATHARHAKERAQERSVPEKGAMMEIAMIERSRFG